MSFQARPGNVAWANKEMNIHFVLWAELHKAFQENS